MDNKNSLAPPEEDGRIDHKSLSLDLGLALSLGPGHHRPQPTAAPFLLLPDSQHHHLLLPSPEFMFLPPQPLNEGESSSGSAAAGGGRLPLKRRSSGRNANHQPIAPPYPWATDLRATVHSLNYLQAKGMTKITGKVRCKRCDRFSEIQYDLVEKFEQLRSYIAKNQGSMHDRAPGQWKDPVLPKCGQCGKANSLKPVMTKKKAINWLFLLLGELIGSCKLDELKYFCKHTSNHRTGSRERLIYITYMVLCKQLDPTGPFHINK